MEETVKIIVRYVDSKGTQLKDDSFLEGLAGSEYQDKIVSIKGYELLSPKEAYKGVFEVAEEGSETVLTYTYERIKIKTVEISKVNTHLKTMDDKRALTVTIVPEDAFDSDTMEIQFSGSNKNRTINTDATAFNKVSVTPVQNHLAQGNESLLVKIVNKETNEVYNEEVNVEFTFELVPTGLSVDKEVLEVVTEEKGVKITPSVSPKGVLEKRINITYTSVNTDIVEVDSDGNVIPIKAGSTIIEVRETGENLVSEVAVIVTEKEYIGNNKFTCKHCGRTMVGDSFTVFNRKYERYILCPYDGMVVYETKE